MTPWGWHLDVETCSSWYICHKWSITEGIRWIIYWL